MPFLFAPGLGQYQGSGFGLGVNDDKALTSVSGINELGNISVASWTTHLQRRLGSTDGTIVNGVCVDYTVDGYFASRGAPLSGVPSGFVTRPPSISPCELESLHGECVERINMYRSGQLKFSDGSSDSNVVAGLSPVQEMTGSNQCSSHQALGDLVRAKPSGYGCAGAHFTAFTCASGAQNSCCSWYKETTYNGVKQRLFQCLQSMWDEGITPGIKGHWETMRSTSYAYASCGFAWDQEGQLTMNQDFFRRSVSGECSCKDKQDHENDGCGGNCVACTEPLVAPCQDSARTNTWSSSCSGPPSSSGRPYCTCQDVQRFSWCRYSFIKSSCPLTCNSCPVLEPTCPSTTPTTTINTTPSIKSGDVIFLKVYSGSGNLVDVEGSLVQARWAQHGNWQALIIEKDRDGTISSGDTIYLKTHTGAHIDVDGDSVQARWHDMGALQALTIEKPGGGIIMPDDLVCFRAQHSGKHIDVQEGILRARWDDCGAWQAMRLEKEHADALWSGDAVHLMAHTGNMIDIESNSVQARWNDRGPWQRLVIDSTGGRTIFAGDTVFLQAHTGKYVDVEGGRVQARWQHRGEWQQFTIEKIGGGSIYPGDTCFLLAHTAKHVEVEGSAVAARWHDQGAWQSFVIEKAAGRRLQVKAAPIVEMRASLMDGALAQMVVV